MDRTIFFVKCIVIKQFHFSEKKLEIRVETEMCSQSARSIKKVWYEKKYFRERCIFGLAAF